MIMMKSKWDRFLLDGAMPMRAFAFSEVFRRLLMVSLVVSPVLLAGCWATVVDEAPIPTATPGGVGATPFESSDALAAAKAADDPEAVSGALAEESSPNSEEAPPNRAVAANSITRLRLLVPAYFHPSGTAVEEWRRLFDAAAQVPIVVVVNPASGPGTTVEKAYADLMKNAEKRKVVTVGYLNTDYAKRPLEDVKTDIQAWKRLYPAIRGFFFDLQSSGVKDLSYYQALSEYARAQLKDALIVANPGTICDEEYLAKATADVECVFELPDGFGKFELPLWAENHPSDKFAALPYNVEGQDAMRVWVQEALRKKIGYIYITDRKGANPWGSLPSYWNDEVEAVRQANQRQLP